MLKWFAPWGVLLMLAGCDGLITGEKVLSQPVSESTQGETKGGFGPITLALTPDMTPVALNLRVEHGIDGTLAGKWNHYLATLTFKGREVAASKFQINYSGNADGQAGVPYILQNMLTAKVAEAGDYVLTIVPLKANEIKLTSVRVEMRRNVEGNANAR
jgi:hypothetical protein